MLCQTHKNFSKYSNLLVKTSSMHKKKRQGVEDFGFQRIAFIITLFKPFKYSKF